MEATRAPLERTIDSPATIEGIAIVRWPEEELRNTQLARARTPRILVVEPECPPPEIETDDPFVDWVRDPIDERELQAHVVALLERASAVRPILGDHGVVWRGATWIALSPIEERLTAAFLARPGRVLEPARGSSKRAGPKD